MSISTYFLEKNCKVFEKKCKGAKIFGHDNLFLGWGSKPFSKCDVDPPISSSQSHASSCLDYFLLIFHYAVQAIIGNSKRTTSSLDPVPSSLVIVSLLSLFTQHTAKIINCSISLSPVQTSFKHGQISILKKPQLDINSDITSGRLSRHISTIRYGLASRLALHTPCRWNPRPTPHLAF